MCCEDLKIARKTVSADWLIIGTGADQQLLPADLNRVAIIFQGNTGAAGSVSTLPLTGNTDGMRFFTTQAPPPLDIWHHGDIVRREWRVFTNAAARVKVTTISLVGMCDDNKRPISGTESGIVPATNSVP